jgi:hypothetical protein
VADLRASKRFYDLLAHHAGVRWGVRQDGRVHYAAANRSFAIVDDAPVTDSLHVAFPAHDNAAVDEFHRVLTAAGYRDNGSPGERPEYHPG